MSELLEGALEYARHGWCVFPCDPAASGPRSKQPLVGRDRDASGKPIAKTGGLYKASRDPAQVVEWWRKWPAALIGVRMGAEANAFAVDPDVPKRPGDADGLTAWHELAAQHGGIVPTRMHRTPSGGLHILFRWDNGRQIGNREGRLPPGINVRGEGGYVIAPPSRLADGRKYELIEPKHCFELADAPNWLYEILLPTCLPKSHDTFTAEGNAKPRLVLSPNERYIAAAIDGECRAVAAARPGSRNNQLNHSAFKLGTLVGSGALHEHEASSRLFEAAKSSGLLDDDGLAAVTATISSGLDAGAARPRDLTPLSARAASPASSVITRGPEVTVVTQDSVALLFARHASGRLRYCHHTGAWFEWTGTHWRQDETELAFQFARELGREASRQATQAELKEARKVTFAAGVERFARGTTGLAVTSSEWDRDGMLIGTPSGTVDLKTGEVRGADAADGITKQTAVGPAKSIECSRWLSFLNDATGGDAALVRFMQQWAGYCLTGDTREHSLVFVYGAGGNGKTVFLNTISRIAGTYAVTAPMDTFVQSKGERHPTDLAMLRGARMVTSSETEEGRPWAETRIKQLTGGDAVTARFMRQDFFTYVPQFKLTIVGNHKPLLRNVDDAARRRFNLVPFTRKPLHPDRELEAKLQLEWPGILRWMIIGCRDWQMNGLIRPESVRAATAAYFDNQDLLGQWLEEECDCEPGNQYKQATTAELFEAWSAYAHRAGEDASSKKSFSEQMQKRDFQAHRGSGGARGFRGVRLRSIPFSRAGE